MASFDIVCKVEPQEIKNALDQAHKEIANRYDFKGTGSDLQEGDGVITLVSQDDMRLEALEQVLRDRLARRDIPALAYTLDEPQPASEGRRKKTLSFQSGIPQDKAKEIVKLIKGMKSKVQAQIQGDQLRVTAKKIDDLQDVMQTLRRAELGIHMEFTNMKR